MKKGLFLLGFFWMVGGWVTSAQDSELPDLSPPTFGDFDPASVEGISLEDYPVIPDVTPHTEVIFNRGSQNASFSKVGDCMTASAFFFAPFGEDDYILGEYENLSDTIAVFNTYRILDTYTPFNHPGLATESGFNTASVIDPLWADPNFCNSEETPLACEYRIAEPSFSFIMFGTNDVFVLDAASFDFYLRSIVLETIQSDIVPVLSTFPKRPEFPDETVLYNQIIIKITEDYDLPLVNLWLSIDDLEFNGVDQAEPIHLSIPPNERTGDFTEENLAYGYTMRNLVMLQTLDNFWQTLNAP